MAVPNYNSSNATGQIMNTGMNMGQMQQPMQQPYYPYANNMLLNSSPYDNYMNRASNSMFNQQQMQQGQYLKCRPVSSRQEARAYQIDLDGSLWVFTDIGNGKIYTKQINNDGTAEFKTYNFVEEMPNQIASEYVTKQEFDKVVQSLVGAVAALKQQRQESKVQTQSIPDFN